VGLLGDELVRAVVPDLDRARAVLPRRNLTGEGRVLERVVLDVDGESTGARLEWHALRHRPGGEGAVALEAEVVVGPPRVVAVGVGAPAGRGGGGRETPPPAPPPAGRRPARAFCGRLACVCRSRARPFFPKRRGVCLPRGGRKKPPPGPPPGGGVGAGGPPLA